MKSNFLLPHWCKKLGGTIILIFFAVWVGITLYQKNHPMSITWKMFAIANHGFGSDDGFFKWIDVGPVNTVIGAMLILGFIFISFSKEKQEDEYINSVRLNAWQWALLANYILLFLCFIFVYNMDFFAVMVYNIYTIPVIFFLRFQYLLYKNSKKQQHD